jgi:hypothetical protein
MANDSSDVKLAKNGLYNYYIVLKLPADESQSDMIFSGDPLQNSTKSASPRVFVMTAILCNEEENGNCRMIPTWVSSKLSEIDLTIAGTIISNFSLSRISGSSKDQFVHSNILREQIQLFLNLSRDEMYCFNYKYLDIQRITNNLSCNLG